MQAIFCKSKAPIPYMEWHATGLECWESGRHSKLFRSLGFHRRLHTVSLFNIGFARVISNKQNGDDQEENGHS